MKVSDMPAPFSWSKHIKSSIMNVISLAHWAIVYTRSMCANSPQGTCPEVLPKAGSGTCPLIKKLRGKLERTRNEITLLKEGCRSGYFSLIGFPDSVIPILVPFNVLFFHHNITSSFSSSCGRIYMTGNVPALSPFL